MGSNTYKRTSESAIGCSASNSRGAFKKSMNHYAVENLFGIEGLNIAWYGIIITFGISQHSLSKFKGTGNIKMELLLLAVFFYFLNQFLIRCIFQQIHFHPIRLARFQIFSEIISRLARLFTKSSAIKINTAPYGFLIYACHNLINIPIAFPIFRHISISTVDDDRFSKRHHVL